MADYGEWNSKDATLSDVTAQKEYGVSREFIIKGIKAGKLEYREGSIWGNPYLRILRSQLEKYIEQCHGRAYLQKSKKHDELRKIKKEIISLNKKLKLLESKQKELEDA